MTIIVTRICNKCKKEVGHGQNDQFWRLGIKGQCYTSHNSMPTRLDNISYMTGFEIDVCRACLESFGIAVQTKYNEPPKPVPSVEEAIREIINIAMQEYSPAN